VNHLSGRDTPAARSPIAKSNVVPFPANALNVRHRGAVDALAVFAERVEPDAPLHVLVLADDSGLFRLLPRLLPVAGCVIEDASDLGHCFEKAAGHAFDAVIVDATMPDDSAYTAVQRLREMRPGLCIIAIGGRRLAPMDRAGLLRAGADDTMDGVVRAPELEARMRRIVETYRARRREPLRVEGLAVTPTGATLGRRPLGLTPWETALLGLLLAWPDRIINRSAIDAHLYAGRPDTGSNVVDVFVSKIRRKIADTGLPAPDIENVTGFGFRLNTHAARIQQAIAAE